MIISKRGKNNHLFTLQVEEAATSVEDNTSTVSIRFQLSEEMYCTWIGWGNYIRYSVKVGDNTYSGSIPAYGRGKTDVPLVLVSDTIVIQHENDGTKGVDISFSVMDSAKADYTCGSVNDSGTLELTSIPRATTFSIEPNDVLTKGQVLFIDAEKQLEGIDTITGTCNGHIAFSFTHSDVGNYQIEVPYETIFSSAELEESSNYLLAVTIESAYGSNSETMKISTGTMPLSVLYRDGEYGICFGKKATEVNKIVSRFPVEIGDSSTDLELLLNGKKITGGVEVNDEEDIRIGTYNGKDVYLRYVRWSSGQVSASGTRIALLGAVDDCLALNYNMTPSSKYAFWSGSVRDGSYYHQGVQLIRATGELKVFYQDGWSNGTIVNVLVIYTKADS